jgi:hypothetical protein
VSHRASEREKLEQEFPALVKQDSGPAPSTAKEEGQEIPGGIAVAGLFSYYCNIYIQVRSRHHYF